MLNDLINLLTMANLNNNQKTAGCLDLSGLTSIPDGFNPTVGGYLDLRGLTSIPDGFNPTVGGYLGLSGLTCDYKKIFNGQIGNGWIYADNILTHITNKIIKTKGFTYYKGKIPNHNIITDGTNYAHCDSIKNGIIDLRFKLSDRNTSQYKKLTINSVVSFEDAVIMYRTITGACNKGTASFIKTIEPKKEYKISEIIDITDGKYNNILFKNFFNGKN